MFDKKQERLLLFILATVQFLHIVDFMIIMPLEPQLSRIFQITAEQFSVIVASYTLSAGISGFCISFFVDRFDRKKLLMAAFIGFVLGTFACAFAPSYVLMVAARSLSGRFGGVMSGLVLSIIGDVLPPERRATGMGVVMAAFSVASIMGVPLSLYIAKEWNWKAPFFVLGGLGLLVVGLIAQYVPPINRHLKEGAPKSSPLETLSRIFSNPNQRLALLTMVLLMLGQFSVIPYITPSLVGNAGLAEDKIFLVYFIGGMFTVVTSPLVGKIADKRGRLPVFTVAVFASLVPLLALTHLGPTPEPLIFTVTTLMFISVGSRMIPAMAMITSTVEPRYRGSFMSINSCVQQLASSAASLVAGQIIVKDAAGHLLNYNYVGYIAVGASLLCWVAARRLKAVA